MHIVSTLPKRRKGIPRLPSSRDLGDFKVRVFGDAGRERYEDAYHSLGVPFLGPSQSLGPKDGLKGACGPLRRELDLGEARCIRPVHPDDPGARPLK